MKILFASVTLLFLSACGILSSDSDGPSVTNENWEYEYSENGCSTGKITGTTKIQQCEALKDDQRNNYCAKSTRETVFKELCEINARTNTGGSDPGPGPGPVTNPDKKVCGYAFESIEDSIAVRAVLTGTWLTRRQGILSEQNPSGTRSYKDGFYFDFTGSELSSVRVYHTLNGAALNPTAISIPSRANEILISTAITSGIYQGWHLIQWETEKDRCTTIAVGLERKDNELTDTLLVIGPKSFNGAGDIEAPGVAEFFKEPNIKREYLPLGRVDLPRWEQVGL
jgi:hypothetical protein